MVDVKTFDEFHLTDDPWDYKRIRMTFKEGTYYLKSLKIIRS